ncbi:MAG: M48 family metallopeptidase [Bacteroidales bacterium]|uniref:M48 family metallopeptidase n=1 Tax=Porphyromonas sp. TaxID=1924944 RepID=UPI0029779313|nr:M48 family metallopeptidase [Porphyromonas sp.]MDD7438562.1 M48 family metallopeptidase [Bacteroidales bacterium]MDY3066867.1 M48 family metallopeptidase [Porphyromonas sp.]
MAVAVLLSIGLASCSTVAFSGRNRINLIPDSQVLQASFAQYADFMSKAPKSQNTKETQKVAQIGERIARATDAYLRASGLAADADSYRWEFNLIASDQANAFCMPGGKIVVYEGILPIARSNDQLATVISHEVAHAVAKHANERMSQQVLQQYGASALGLFLGGKGVVTQQMANILYSVGTQAFFTLPYSRKHEYEADIIGLYLMAIAGYDYTQAEQFWINMAGGNTKEGQSDFWSTHPNDAKRIQAIREELPKVRAFMNGEKTSAPTPENAAKITPTAKKTVNMNDINKGRSTPLQLKY